MTQQRVMDALDGRSNGERGAENPSHRGPAWVGHGIALVRLAGDVVHFFVAIVLVAVGVYVLWHAGADFVTGSRAFVDRVTGAINGVLFVVIVMEILDTVIAHFAHEGFQLRPFLIIGIISAVRHILSVGAQLSLGSEATGTAFRNAQIELGVSAAVGLSLVIGLVLLERAPNVDSLES